MTKNRLLVGACALAFTCISATASLKPGEIGLKGKLIEDSSKEVTFYVNKSKKEYTFKKSKRPKFLCRVNHEKEKSDVILKLQEAKDTKYVSVVIYFDPKKFDKDKNADYAGYEVRKLGAVTKEYAAEQKKKRDANNPHL